MITTLSLCIILFGTIYFLKIMHDSLTKRADDLDKKIDILTQIVKGFNESTTTKIDRLSSDQGVNHREFTESHKELRKLISNNINTPQNKFY